VRALHESVGAVFAKRHITYRKLFSDEIRYTRSTIIPVDTKEKYIQDINKSSKSEINLFEGLTNYTVFLTIKEIY
jgi:hypothetical protein